MKRAFSIGLCAASLALALPASAREAAPRGCSAAYQGAQARRHAGHLRQARELLLQCALPACGGLQPKCASGAARLNSQLAWLSPVVTDAKGAPIVEVRVMVDGQPWATRLDGRPLAVDPGMHELSFTARVGAWPGHDVTATKKLVVWQGQRGPLPVMLPAADDADAVASAGGADAAGAAASDDGAEASSETSTPSAGTTTDAAGDAPIERLPDKATYTTADRAAAEKASASDEGSDDRPEKAPKDAEPSPAAPAARHGGPSAFTWVLGGVGVLGLGAGALLTYWGHTDNAALAQCSPNCQPSSVDHVKRMYLASDLAFAGGGALLGVSALLFATTRSSEAPASTAVAKPAPRSALRLDVQPTRSGAFATFQGAF